MPIEIKTKKEAEIGSTGLDRTAGIIDEEFLNELKDEKGRAVYTEMSNNDAVVGALLFATDMLIRSVIWDVMPVSDDRQDIDAADFVNSNMQNMTMTWNDLISEILSMLPFGWSYHEIVYGVNQSGQTVWKKIPIRGQCSLDRWDFDKNGGLLAMVQSPPPDFRIRVIPIEKALLFRTQIKKNNPEGKSILRNAYRSYYFLKNIQNIEGIGIERDLAGLPVAMVPSKWMHKDATPAQKNLLRIMKTLVTKIKRNENEGVILPSELDDNGNPIVDLKLLTSGGKRNFDTSKIIERYETRILMSVMADFIMLGNKNVGSFSLADSKTKIFATAIGAWVDSIAETFNRFAIPRLFNFNTFNVSNGYPKITHGDVESVDLAQLSTFVLSLAQAGAELTDADFNFLRKQGGLPVNVEG